MRDSTNAMQQDITFVVCAAIHSHWRRPLLSAWAPCWGSHKPLGGILIGRILDDRCRESADGTLHHSELVALSRGLPHWPPPHACRLRAFVCAVLATLFIGAFVRFNAWSGGFALRRRNARVFRWTAYLSSRDLHRHRRTADRSSVVSTWQDWSA